MIVECSDLRTVPEHAEGAVVTSRGLKSSPAPSRSPVN